MNNEMKYESCLWDGYDNNVCCVVHSNRFSAEHEKTTDRRPVNHYKATDNKTKFGKDENW